MDRWSCVVWRARRRRRRLGNSVCRRARFPAAWPAPASCCGNGWNVAASRFLPPRPLLGSVEGVPWVEAHPLGRDGVDAAGCSANGKAMSASRRKPASIRLVPSAKNFPTKEIFLLTWAKHAVLITSWQKQRRGTQRRVDSICKAILGRPSVPGDPLPQSLPNPVLPVEPVAESRRGSPRSVGRAGVPRRLSFPHFLAGFATNGALSRGRCSGTNHE
jgi:hypothetical protein